MFLFRDCAVRPGQALPTWRSRKPWEGTKEAIIYGQAGVQGDPHLLPMMTI